MSSQKILVKYSNQAKGELLYSSQVKIDGKLTDSGIFENLIMISDMCIPYDYDIKFGVSEDRIYFDHFSDTIQLQLPSQDQQQWRKHLKNYLNQRGFHQIFKPIKKIGKGNFASVYLVEKISTKIQYAVKSFSKETAYSEQKGKQCLIKQIQIMRKLKHPNLMNLQEVFQSQNSLYIVFQLLEGGQLQQIMKNKKFALSEIQNIIGCLLAGLKAMHQKNIMHRDLKPENILIRSRNTLQCVIADFGLAEQEEVEQYLFSRCGTPGYVAPQVLNIKDMKTRYNCVCDVFSLGVIFHHLLYGCSVFNVKQYQQIVAANRACKFTFDNQFYQDSCPQALDLLKKMLKVNPDERITSDQAMNHPFLKLQETQQQIGCRDSNKSLKKLSLPLKFTKREDRGYIANKQNADSCLQLKIPRQNIFKGRADTVNDNLPTNVSMMKSVTVNARIIKASKFTKPL